MSRSTARSQSVCPYCGVGCQITYNVKDDRIRYVNGRNGPANENRLCVKGRFGFDYVDHPRPPDEADDPQGRRAQGRRRSDRPSPIRWTHFREATWEEALEVAARGPARDPRSRRRAARSPASARPRARTRRRTCSRSSIRTGFGSNNVDHCTRLCHASSVAALLENIGSGAVTAPFTAAMDADVIVVIGANPTENHPGRGDLLQAGGQARQDPDRDGPARPGAEAPRHATCCSSSPAATSRCSTR